MEGIELMNCYEKDCRMQWMQPWRWLRHSMKRYPNIARSHWIHVPMQAQAMYSRYYHVSALLG
jgi:hypothetical protein